MVEFLDPNNRRDIVVHVAPDPMFSVGPTRRSINACALAELSFTQMDMVDLQGRALAVLLFYSQEEIRDLHAALTRYLDQVPANSNNKTLS